jgi:hypothetical protein
MALPASDNRFDQELMGWCALHGGPWYGTASELFAALKIRVGVGNDSWPQSPRALYSHIESHRQILRSLGVAAFLHHGYPRMVSLRPCRAEEHAGEFSSGTPGITSSSDKAVEKIESQVGDSLDEKEGLAYAQAIPSHDTIDTRSSLTTSATPESMVLGLLASKLASAPTLFWLALKKVWMRSLRVMGIRS